MSERLTTQLRRGVAEAGRAVELGQYSELTGRPVGPAVVGGFCFVVEAFYDALAGLDPFPWPSRRELLLIATSLCGWPIPCAVLLLLAPNPERPWVLTTAIVGLMPLGTLLSQVVHRTANRSSARRLLATQRQEQREPAGKDPVLDAVDSLRRLVAEITGALDPDHREADRTVAEQLSRAEFWLDRVEQAALRT
jgi:hypothetical protein